MTDIEIINEAYGCIAEKANCENCSRDSACTADECMGWLIGDLLDIIERLQERVAIQREPCKYCNPDNTDRAVHSANGEHWITVRLPSECESESMDIPINNCPMCGRNLKEDGK